MVLLKQKIQITAGFSNFLRESLILVWKQVHNTRKSLILTAVSKWCYLPPGEKNNYRYMKLKPKRSNKEKRSTAKKRKVLTIKNKAYGSKKSKSTRQATNVAYVNYLKRFFHANRGMESEELVRKAAIFWCKLKPQYRLCFKQQEQVQQSCKMKTCKKSP